jgi:hypothetical protein
LPAAGNTACQAALSWNTSAPNRNFLNAAAAWDNQVSEFAPSIAIISLFSQECFCLLVMNPPSKKDVKMAA